MNHLTNEHDTFAFPTFALSWAHMDQGWFAATCHIGGWALHDLAQSHRAPSCASHLDEAETWAAKPLTRSSTWAAKPLSFFGFSQFFNHHFIKKQKTWVFCFFKVKTKKTKKLGKTKKNKHEPQTKHSLKSFGFLVFSRFFWFCQWGFPKESPNIVFCWFSRGFLFFWVFPMDSLPKSRQILFSCFQLVLIVCTATTHKTS